MKRVKLFISSPADVSAECKQALAVVNRLQPEFEEALTLDSVVSAVGSDSAGAHAQQAADFDIFIAIIGGQLAHWPGGHPANGGDAISPSRTEAEFASALQGARQAGRPELLVYRKSFTAGDPDTSQRAAVAAFFDKWFLSAEDKTATAAYHSFAEAEQFTDLFTVHLRKLLRRHLPRPNNLPQPGSSFVGRTQLLREVSGLLRQSDTRLVTLMGPGGTGKSRLGLRVAHDMLPEFEDGVFLISLAALSQADLVPSTIATTLDIKQNDNRPVIETVIDALQNKEMLLLIDNLEQVQSAVAQIDTLVSKCPGIKILLTGREAPRVSGARTVKVPPFSLPDINKASYEEIVASESIQLFLARARAVSEGFQLTEENAGQVLQICHRLDGLPLAIELATSRLRAMDTSELLKSMDQRFAVLDGGTEELLDHQRSLRELISWSYDLLSEDEQRLWRRMAVFTGGFAMEAAEEVCDPEDEFIVDIEVEGLVDKSLANLSFHTLEDGEEEARVSMLDTLREYALMKLEESGELSHFRERFCDWVTGLADDSFHELRGAGSDARIALLEMEQVNVQAAIDYCLNLANPDWNRALRIGGGVWFYWFERGILSTSRRLFEQALEERPDVEKAVRALALRALGSVARFQNDLDIAERACLKALDLYSELQDDAGQANVLGELGAIAERQGDMEKAADKLDRALQLFSMVPGDLHGLSFASAARGVINHLEGDLAGARAYYEAALSAGSESGDTDSIASALVNLGEVAEAEANYEQAYEHYAQSLDLFAHRGKKVAIAYCAEIIAGLSCKHRKKYSDAALFFGFAEALRAETESPIESFNAERLEADIRLTRKAMNEETFRASWDAGASLEVDEFLLLIRDIELSGTGAAVA
ncbi:tetratricopeptide repeat protein [Pseudohalioglobus sediminis]|uniref:Tetratricopeptide repeat protein n=1 Tax=Pseudohalioglobus sediminis TaxID=2606449 RepID=A0A5B0WW30_9GAMM|nr:tetratricopeptide repeat protein [Pseudohalioglobus sediminis]KAA1190089.1 tetratricopeptide repeat protein [Pseudohalioglobus sediminis]